MTLIGNVAHRAILAALNGLERPQVGLICHDGDYEALFELLAVTELPADIELIRSSSVDPGTVLVFAKAPTPTIVNLQELPDAG